VSPCMIVPPFLMPVVSICEATVVLVVELVPVAAAGAVDEVLAVFSLDVVVTLGTLPPHAARTAALTAVVALVRKRRRLIGVSGSRSAMENPSSK